MKITETIKQYFEGYKDTEISSESVESQWLFEFIRGVAKVVKFGE